MKTYVSVAPGLIREQVPAPIFEELCALIPEDLRTLFGVRDRFDFKFNDVRIDDARLPRIFELLRQAHMYARLPQVGGKDKNAFPLKLTRKYSRRDLEACEYYKVFGTTSLDACRETVGDQRVQLRTTKIRRAEKAGVAVANAWYVWVVVPDRVKRLIEASGMIGPKFLPTVARAKTKMGFRDVEWSRVGEPWWELTSNVKLPPLWPTMLLTDRHGVPIREDYSNGCLIHDDYYTTMELKYRRDDLKKVEPFDLACTHEMIGPPIVQPNERLKVASRRFYEFFKANNLRASWTPVRVIDGDVGEPPGDKWARGWRPALPWEE